MPTFIFVPRCLVCREPAAVVDESNYYCGTCFLERTIKRHHEARDAEPTPALASKAS